MQSERNLLKLSNKETNEIFQVLLRLTMNELLQVDFEYIFAGLSLYLKLL